MFLALFILTFAFLFLYTPLGQGWVGGGARSARIRRQPFLGVAMRDHDTNYSKGSTEPARMMTPFLASNVFGFHQIELDHQLSVPP
jgi:hypothetical protein